MRHDALFAELERAVLDAAAVLPAATRRAVASGPAGARAPDVAREFVAKVHAQAYKITDDEVAALRASGLSEDEIYELAVAAAVGAGLDRLAAARRSLGGAA